MCLRVSRLFWVSSLAYSNLLGTKGYVVVVVVVVRWHKPRTYLALKLTPSPNGPKQDSIGPRHREVPSGVSKMIFEAMVLSPQTLHLSSIKISTIWKQTETSF
jgi:hypothetical protein